MDGLIAYALSKKYVDGKTSSLATGMSWKGTKENVSSLPQSGNQVGDLWHVNEDGNKYAWDGSKWETLGGIGSSITIDSALSTTSENPVQNKVINVALGEKYTKPSGGIPKTDLAADVKTSLGKADTALQTAPVTSVNNKTGAVTLSASDVGALPSSTSIPTKVSDLTNDSGFQTAAQVSAAIGSATASKADKTLRVAMTASDTTPTLDPNKLYVFPEMASLTPTLATPSDNTIVNEYHFMFTSGATATTLTLPASVLQPDGFSVEANYVYEVSIVENCMTAQGWAVTST